MKVKVSLSLSEDLVAALDQLASKAPRSAFIERILQRYIDDMERARRDAREIALINRHAAKLNAEMKDALSFQSDFAE